MPNIASFRYGAVKYLEKVTPHSVETLYTYVNGSRGWNSHVQSPLSVLICVLEAIEIVSTALIEAI